MLFVGTSIIHPSTEGVFLLCNILDLLIYSSKVEYGDDGMPVYRYFWENEEVSSEEYERKLNEVYDTEKEVKIFQDAQYDSEKGRYVGNGLCDYQEIIEAIEETSVLN